MIFLLVVSPLSQLLSPLLRKGGTACLLEIFSCTVRGGGQLLLLIFRKIVTDLAEDLDQCPSHGKEHT